MSVAAKLCYLSRDGTWEGKVSGWRFRVPPRLMLAGSERSPACTARFGTIHLRMKR